MATATLTRTAIPVGTWMLDKAHTKLGFAVKHMGVSTVRGEFRDFDGTLEVDEDGESSRAYGIVRAASVNTNQEQRDEHLRSADFFDAEATLRSASSRRASRRSTTRTIRIVGDLTIHGVTREIELDAESWASSWAPAGRATDRSRGHRPALPQDYGMKFNAALGSGNAVVADKVKLVLDIAAVKQD